MRLHRNWHRALVNHQLLGHLLALPPDRVVVCIEWPIERPKRITFCHRQQRYRKIPPPLPSTWKAPPASSGRSRRPRKRPPLHRNWWGSPIGVTTVPLLSNWMVDWLSAARIASPPPLTMDRPPMAISSIGAPVPARFSITTSTTPAAKSAVEAEIAVPQRNWIRCRRLSGCHPRSRLSREGGTAGRRQVLMPRGDPDQIGVCPAHLG